MKKQQFGWYVSRGMALFWVLFGMIIFVHELELYLRGRDMDAAALTVASLAMLAGGLIVYYQAFAKALAQFKVAIELLRPLLSALKIGGRRKLDPAPDTPAAKVVEAAKHDQG